MYKKLSAPLFVQVETTTKCTQACTHCYNFWRQKESGHTTLTVEKVDKIVEQLTSAKVFRVIVTGGEPLLVPGISLYLVSELAKAGIRVHFNTNLVPLTTSLADGLVASGVHSVLTSLMSYDPVTHDSISHLEGSWKSTVAGVKLLMRRGLTPGVNMVVSTLNFEDVYATGKFVASLTGKAFTATKAICPATGVAFPYRLTRKQVQETIKTLYRLRKETGLFVDALEHYAYCLIGDATLLPHLTQRRCSAAVTSCTVGADGTVRPCSHAPVSYGDVFETGLVAAWDSMGEWRDGSLIPTECRSCKHLNACSGGCRVEALVVDGHLSGMDPYATNEDDVLALPRQANPPDDFLQTTVVVNTPLSRRVEPYGVVVSGVGEDIAFINEDTSIFLQQLECEGPAQVKQLQQAYDLNDTSIAFLWFLVGKGVLKVVNRLQ